MEEKDIIKVYIKVNSNGFITDIGSDIFIDDLTEWIYIDKGYGVKYAHAQNNYLEKSIFDDDFYRYKYVDGQIIEVDNSDKKALIENMNEVRLLREKRQKILIAFDKYKTNVQYGIEEETPIRHNEIMEWYQDMLDLKAEAFDNIPKRVQYYL